MQKFVDLSREFQEASKYWDFLKLIQMDFLKFPLTLFQQLLSLLEVKNYLGLWLNLIYKPQLLIQIHLNSGGLILFFNNLDDIRKNYL